MRVHQLSQTIRFSAAALLLLALLWAWSALMTPVAAVAPPNTMNFQGRLTDPSGQIMADGQYNMQFRIYAAGSGGTALWTETREAGNRVQVTNGLFSVQLGAVNPLSASLFNTSDLYFEITMATPGTATCSTASCASWESPMTPRNKLATSAYAFNAALLDGKSAADFASATGAAGYIQNTTSPQTADFNITGAGVIDTSMIVGNGTDRGVIMRRTNAGAGLGANLVVRNHDGGGNRTAMYVASSNGNTFEAGRTSIYSAKVTTSASNVGLIIQGAASQSANLLQVRDSSDAVVFLVSNNGSATVNNTLNLGTPGSTNAANITSPNNDGSIRLIPNGGNPNTARLQVGSNGTISFNGTSTLTNAASNSWAPSGYTVNFTGGDITHSASYAFRAQNNSGNTTFNVNPHGSTTITNYAATDTALTLQAAASQSSEMFRINASGGTAMVAIGGAGNATFRNSSNSTTAFQIQNAGGATFFAANTSNSTIVIGSGANTITLGSTGVTYAGTARPTSTVTLSAEYPGATFTADGSNNTGSLSSDFCSGSSRLNINAAACAATVSRNFYQWTTDQASNQDYDIYVRYQMPSDYSTGSLANLAIQGWGTTTASESVTVALYSDASGTACATSGNAVTANATWSSATIASPLGSCTVSAGDTVTFRVRVQAGQNKFARAGAISFDYRETR